MKYPTPKSKDAEKARRLEAAKAAKERMAKQLLEDFEKGENEASDSSEEEKSSDEENESPTVAGLKLSLTEKRSTKERKERKDREDQWKTNLKKIVNGLCFEVTSKAKGTKVIVIQKKLLQLLKDDTKWTSNTAAGLDHPTREEIRVFLELDPAIKAMGLMLSANEKKPAADGSLTLPFASAAVVYLRAITVKALWVLYEEKPLEERKEWAKVWFQLETESKEVLTKADLTKARSYLQTKTEEPPTTTTPTTGTPEGVEAVLPQRPTPTRAQTPSLPNALRPTPKRREEYIQWMQDNKNLRRCFQCGGDHARHACTNPPHPDYVDFIGTQRPRGERTNGSFPPRAPSTAATGLNAPAVTPEQLQALMTLAATVVMKKEDG